ncbi:MAG TPA: flagellar motor switch phosphatase FliY [Atribacteraceae bacterium]|nr:flagellar motor switch phosphatase FliY [Atribacteraceae bacterium]
MAVKTMDSGYTLSSEEVDVLGEVGNISMGAAATALSGLLTKKVDITIPSVMVMSLDDVKKILDENHILVKVQYQSGLTGSNVLLVQENDIRVIIGLMMGGDGKDGLPEVFGEMEISALGEAMNQMMGSAATAMSDFFARRVNISPPEVIWQNVRTEEESWLNKQGDAFIVMTTFRLVVEDVIDSSMLQLVPLSFAREMAGGLLSNRAVESEAENQEETFEQEIFLEEAVPLSSPDKSPIATQPQAPPRSSSAPRREKSRIKAQPVEFAEFVPDERAEGSRGNLELIMDVSLPLVVELGKSRLSIREILDLGPGSIIELDKLAGEPADLYVHDILFARGEVVVIEENFGVRISEIVSTEDRIRSLREVRS